MRQQWEYLIEVWNIGSQSPQVVTEDMNEMGAQGWDLVQATNQGMSMAALFKRPIEPQPSPLTYEKRDDD